MNLKEGEVSLSEKSQKSRFNTLLVRLTESGYSEEEARRIVAALSRPIKDLQRKSKEANTDELTGLFNRRGFKENARAQFELAKRTKNKVFLMFADLDGLKEINDAYGHSAGDQALIDTACLLQATFRELDIVARWSGDEFLVFGVETTQPRGKKDAGNDDERVSIDAFDRRLQDNLDIFNGTELRRYSLSLSRGVIPWDPENPGDIKDFEALVTEADRLMYEQKRAKGILRSE